VLPKERIATEVPDWAIEKRLQVVGSVGGKSSWFV
jgi:hypothetical protein